MKVIYFSKTDHKGPASRYRIFQFARFFEQRGFELKILPAFSDRYIEAESLKGVRRIFWRSRESAIAFIKRLFGFFRIFSADVVAIEREFFPCFPPIFELLISTIKGGYILEFDDAIFLSGGRRRKYPATVKMASKVIVGNRYLEKYALKFNEKTFVIPTCVDTKKYPLKTDYDTEGPLQIGWIGLPYNFFHIVSIAEALRKIFDEHEGELVVVSAKEPDIDIPNKFVKWHLETEGEILRTFDIGIMPLDDTPYSRGKCGLKLLQYMAAGVPVVASPVGVNSEIVINGVNGFLAGDHEEWYESIKTLLEDRDMREKMGREGRRTVEERYCLSLWGEKLVSVYLEEPQ